MQIRADLEDVVEVESQLSHRHPVPERNRPERIRLTGPSWRWVIGIRQRGVENRTLDDVAGDWIRPVQHDERLVEPGSGAHRVHHCSDVRPGSRAYILEIEHERIEPAQKTVGRRRRLLSVKRVNWQPALLVDSARDVLAILGSAKPVFGREQLDQVHGGVARLPVSEQVDIRGSLLVDASLVRQQPNALPADELDAVIEENRDAGLDLGFGELRCGVDLLADDNAAAADWKENCEQPKVSHHRWVSCKLVVFDRNMGRARR